MNCSASMGSNFVNTNQKSFGNKRSKKLHSNAAHSRAHSAALQLFIREHILAFTFRARLLRVRLFSSGTEWLDRWQLATSLSEPEVKFSHFWVTHAIKAFSVCQSHRCDSGRAPRFWALSREAPLRTSVGDCRSDAEGAESSRANFLTVGARPLDRETVRRACEPLKAASRGYLATDWHCAARR